MSSAIHYRFKTAKNWDSITFEGGVLSVIDLKRGIVAQQKLGKSTDFDLLLTNATTGEDYKDDNFLITKNSSVIVRRVPAARARTLQLFAPPNEPSLSTAPATHDAAQSSVDASMVALVNNASSQARQPFSGMGRGRGRGMDFKQEGPPPPGYICFRCNLPGHWIRNCPTNDDPNFATNRPKPSTGIPRSFLKIIDAPPTGDAAPGGAIYLPDGRLAIHTPNTAAFQQAMGKDRRTAIAQEQISRLSEFAENEQPPPNYMCGLCRDFIRDATMVPCCHQTYCDEDIRHCLLADANMSCPSCKEHITLDSLKPNPSLQAGINAWMAAHHVVRKDAEKKAVSEAPFHTAAVGRPSGTVSAVQPVSAATAFSSTLATTAPAVQSNITVSAPTMSNAVAAASAPAVVPVNTGPSSSSVSAPASADSKGSALPVSHPAAARVPAPARPPNAPHNGPPNAPLGAPVHMAGFDDDGGHVPNGYASRGPPPPQQHGYGNGVGAPAHYGSNFGGPPPMAPAPYMNHGAPMTDQWGNRLPPQMPQPPYAPPNAGYYGGPPQQQQFYPQHPQGYGGYGYAAPPLMHYSSPAPPMDPRYGAPPMQHFGQAPVPHEAPTSSSSSKHRSRSGSPHRSSRSSRELDPEHRKERSDHRSRDSGRREDEHSERSHRSHERSRGSDDREKSSRHERESDSDRSRRHEREKGDTRERDRDGHRERRR